MANKIVNCPRCGTLTTCLGGENDPELSGTCPSCSWGIVIDNSTAKCITHEELIRRGDEAKAARQREALSGKK